MRIKSILPPVCAALLTALFLFLSAPARAAEMTAEPIARDITAQCKFRLSHNRNQRVYLFDNTYKTYWHGEKYAWIEIETPADDPCFGLYVKWAETLVDYVIETPDGDQWKAVAASPKDQYYNQYLPVGGLTRLRIRATSPDPFMCVNEIHVLSRGEVPDDVQRWRPFTGKADLMVLVAHPDDELLYMGGVIPYYGGQLQKKVIVCYISKQPASRKSELLDGLWTCGIREYPEMPGSKFPDKYTNTLKDGLNAWNREKLLGHVVGLLRKYQPDVVVTHDLKGEYGHGAHRACAYALTECVTAAADPTVDPATAELYGSWQVKKLYLHLYKENEVVMDWRQPLSAFDGQTAFDIACAAFKRHRTQQSGKYQVRDSGHDDNRRFGLYYTAVGPDEQKNDLFEHIR